MSEYGVLKMKKIILVNNQNGTTLLEAMIAIFILTIGILAVMGMQIQAIGASGSAQNRTEANNVSLALLETLKEMDFADPARANYPLTETIASPGALLNDGNENVFTLADFPEMAFIIQAVAGAAAGTVIDRFGVTYQLSWDVQDSTLGTGETPYKCIRVYMTWNSSRGQNRLEMTTIKYNDISL